RDAAAGLLDLPGHGSKRPGGRAGRRRRPDLVRRVLDVEEAAARPGHVGERDPGRGEDPEVEHWLGRTRVGHRDESGDGGRGDPGETEHPTSPMVYPHLRRRNRPESTRSGESSLRAPYVPLAGGQPAVEKV